MLTNIKSECDVPFLILVVWLPGVIMFNGKDSDMFVVIVEQYCSA